MKRVAHLERERDRTCFRAECLRRLVALIALVSTSTVLAQLTVVPPFIGDHHESWDEFGVTDILNGTHILGGIASISGTELVTTKTFTLCTVPARPSDGQIFMASERPAGPLVITFSQPVSAFGAHWGSGINCERCCGFPDAPSNLTFQDINGNVVGTDSFTYKGDGTLEWRGWAFATPVATITRIAADLQEGVAMDGLQATVAPSRPPLILDNISTRGLVQTGDQVMIGGFVIAGNAPKQVLVRAIGPTLANLGVPGPLLDPMLSLHDVHNEIAANDDWQSAADAGDIPMNLKPGDPRESAILITLPPGQYTAIVSGKAGATGIGLVEVYDLEPSSDSTLSNISTRSFVGTGDNVMIGGFIAAGPSDGNNRFLIRAIGPSLSGSGVANPLGDPVLALFDANGQKITTNDNWKDNQQAAIMVTGLAPTNDLESVILATFTPGAFTAIVSDKSGGSGVALVEVFRVQ